MIYTLIGVGRMQAEDWCTFTTDVNEEEGREYAIAGKSVDMRDVAIYRAVGDGSLWVRPVEEFTDGRFEALIPLLPTVWIMRTRDGGFYPIQPSEKCRAEDHGKLNDHVVSIEDIDGNLLWRRKENA